MAEQQQQVIHTDLYGTWTVQFPLDHGKLQGRPGPGMKNGSKFRITFDVEKKKHILVKLNDLRWNTSSDPIELTENPPGEFVSFTSTTPVDVLEPNGQVHDPGILTLMSKDGVNLIVQIEDPQGQTGHTGTGSAGRP